MLRHFPHGRTARFRIAIGVTLTASLLAVAFTAPGPSVASGDRNSLTHHKNALSSRLADSRSSLDDISSRLLAAQHNLDGAVTDLGAARSRLDSLQSQVHLATVRDQAMQDALAAARQRLSDARVDLRRGVATVASQRAQLVGYAVTNSSLQATQLSTLGLLFGARTTQQALDRAQANSSALDAQLSGLQRLQANQVLLRYTAQRVQQATAQVAARRAAAAAHLAQTQQLESAAVTAEATVQQRVSALQVERDKLSSAKRAELDRIATMKRERAALEAKLRALARQRAAQQAAQQGSSGSSSAGAPVNDGGFLSYPVTNTYVTSPYGMRLHPILHIWELHDGTDLHAPCGTPVYAAADGRVMSEYFNVGYGNRLLIDHGVVDGVSLQTSYNHLSSYVAGVGQQVSRGQLIAYSGTTGWSTACHLHFVVYVNGVTVNPMTWL